MILSRLAPCRPLQQCLRQAGAAPLRPPPPSWTATIPSRPIAPVQRRLLATNDYHPPASNTNIDDLLAAAADEVDGPLPPPPPAKETGIAATAAETPVLVASAADSPAPVSSADYWNNQFGGPSGAAPPPPPPEDPESSSSSSSSPPPPKRLPSTQARVVPYSPSYFSRSPFFNDHLVYINTLLTKYEHLPTLPPEKMPKIAWKGRESFAAAGEHIPAKQYAYAMHIAKRLSQIHPSIVPTEVTDALLTFKRDFDPNVARVKVIPVDHLGRAVGVGRRKRSSARAWVIEGTGEVIVNGKPLCEAFARIHDRESAIWALRVTERMDKYNVYALVEGGGTTGQAEAVAMAVAMGMMGHEPDLKPALRRAGCVTRDPREVERKKPGRLKARKKPAWNAR
jgi:small subunit ribosomal protein S9